MKRLLALALALALSLALAACDVPASSSQSQQETATNPPANDAASSSQNQNQSEAETNPPQIPLYSENVESGEPAANDYVWIVEPTLDYQAILYCEKHNDYHTSIHREEEDKLLDEKTGLPTGEDHIWYGGSSRKQWVCDRQLSSLGYYDGFEGLVMAPIGDFAEKFPDEVNTVKVVYYIDSTKRNPDVEGNFLSEEAFLGDKVLVFGKDFISYNHEINTEVDTELLRGREEGSGRRVANLVAVRNTGDGKHGVIYKNGDVIIPFVFDELLMIDEKTALAKTDGKYGIIGFN